MHDDHFQLLMKSGQKVLEDFVECAGDAVGTADEFASPIEYLLACAMAMQTRHRYPEFQYRRETNADLHGAMQFLARSTSVWGCIRPQVKVGRRRIDFVVTYIRGLDGVGHVGIECDGHAFHEKTKDQAARDKSRDRDLQNMGMRVFRFTGSEIYRDPISCADEAMELAYSSAFDSSLARKYASEGKHLDARRELKYVQ
jgi:very-short-patch-repair endonuclease